jgi:hypothetical protein
MFMGIFALDTNWAVTAEARRHLRWELLASDEVLGVFPSARGDALAVLFAGDRGAFETWARAVNPDGASESVNEVGW